MSSEASASARGPVRVVSGRRPRCAHPDTAAILPLWRAIPDPFSLRPQWQARCAVTAPSATLCIATTGVQGAQLTDWLLTLARSQGCAMQVSFAPALTYHTSVTLTYLTLLPPGAQDATPSALLHRPATVACVVACDLAAADRVLQRGLVTRDQTTLIASTHHAPVLDGRRAADCSADAPSFTLKARAAARAVLFDMDTLARQHGGSLDAVLLGALCAAGVLPFTREAFDAAIRTGQGDPTSHRAAFAAAYERIGPPAGPASAFPLEDSLSPCAPSRAVLPLLERIRHLPPSVHAAARQGLRRMLEYQDLEYASVYLSRLERIAARDAHVQAPLTQVMARNLAMWMCFEDTIHGARSCLQRRIPSLPLRVEEIAGTLPVSLGRRLLRSPRLMQWLRHRPPHGHTSSVRGRLLLHLLARLRPWRHRTLRFRQETLRIETWLSRIEQMAQRHYALAMELARAQRLITGFGEIHERGNRHFTTLMTHLNTLAARPDGAARMARLQEAALADEEGIALSRELAALPGAGCARETRRLAPLL